MAPGERLTGLFREYGPAVYRLCMRTLDDQDAAVAATRATFVRAECRLDKIPAGKARLHWMYRTATRYSLTAARVRKLRLAATATSPQHLSPLALDAYALEVDDADARAAVTQHLASCAACAARLVRARAESDHATQFVMPQIRVQLSQRKVATSWRWFALPALAAMLFGAGEFRTSEADLAVKAAPYLQTYAHRPGSVFHVQDHDALATGDEVRFVVGAHRLPYVLVASIDGAGKANIYYPFDGTTSAPLDDAERIELAGAIKLDDAIGPERVFALFSKTPLQAHDVREQLLQVGKGGAASIRTPRALRVPGVESQATLEFEKSSD